MFKDPLFLEETPYEILNLDPDASIGDINKALQDFIKDKANRARLNKGMTANKMLRDSKVRISIDVLYYCTGKTEKVTVTQTNIGDKVRALIRVPELQFEELYTDLKNPDFTSDYRKIKFLNLKTTDVKGFDEVATAGLESIFIHFDS